MGENFIQTLNPDHISSITTCDQIARVQFVYRLAQAVSEAYIREQLLNSLILKFLVCLLLSNSMLQRDMYSTEENGLVL